LIYEEDLQANNEFFDEPWTVFNDEANISKFSKISNGSASMEYKSRLGDKPSDIKILDGLSFEDESEIETVPVDTKKKRNWPRHLIQKNCKVPV
jgi:hypothetical protein